jgi:SAM-dependent methyltransferase
MSKFDFFRRLEVAKNVEFDLQQLKELDTNDLAVLFQLYYSLEFAIGQVFADSDDRYYPNASFSVLKFMAKLRFIQRICGAGSRFLDVGCGLGNKVWLAQTIGFDAYGIEINQNYADIAGECVGKNRIFCHDGITFPDYDQYDVIYFYNPMPSDELETAIITNAKKDAIIYHAIELRSPPNRASVRLSPRVMRLTDEGTRRCQTSRRRPQKDCKVRNPHLGAGHLPFLGPSIMTQGGVREVRDNGLDRHKT